MEILSINLGRLGKVSGAVFCLGLLWMVLTPERAQACSCAPPPTPQDALESAVAVFEGRVIAVAPLEEREIGPSPQQVTIQVVRTFKGADQERLTLVTAGDTAMCGYPFKPNASYLVYADGGGERLRVSLCSRTRPIEQAEEDLAALGMGYVPADPVKADEPGELATKPSPTREPDTQPSQRPRGGGCASCSVGSTASGDAPSLHRFWPWGALTLLVVARRLRPCRRKSRSPS